MATEQVAQKSRATTVTRRAPVQARSRRRVEAILDAAARLVVDRGVDALTTRDIAEAAGVPVASLYQYFADKGEVLLAIVERDMAEMDDQVATDLAALRSPTVATMVEAAMRAFVKVYLRRRAFVEIYLRGRANPVLDAYGRAHNVAVARSLRAYALDARLARPELTETAAVLAVEVGDRIFQLAFEHDHRGDAALIDEGIAMMTAYLERYAVPAPGGP